MEGIDDIFPPYIVAPADVEAEAGECLVPVDVALGTPTVGDDCMVVAVTNDAPETFPLGTNVVTWTVFDEAGNSSNSVQIVTVVPSRTGDCDGDGLTDYEEVVTHGTDWNCSDTDGDGLSDGEEVALETFPLLPDSDGDGWTDGEEVLDAETDPLDPLSAPRLARGVLLHAVKYSAAADSQWVQLHCSGPREVDISGFRLQVAGTNWETQVTFPANTWMVPGHFLLIGGTNVPNVDIEDDLDLPESYSGLPTAGLRLMAPDNSTNAPVDVLMYGSHVPFNEQGLDTTGWLSETTNLWASSTRHLTRWTLGHDTDREQDWRHNPDTNVIYNAATILDSDGDALTDEQEYTGARTGGMPTNPLSLDSDEDGLWDGFEVRQGLNPLSEDSAGTGVGDYSSQNPITGNTYGHDQFADGVSATWTAMKSDWSMGSSIGSNGWVRFTVTPIDTECIWACIAEGGHTPEEFTYTISGATVLYEETRNVGGFTRLYLLLSMNLRGDGCNIEIHDASGNSGIADPNQMGADISGTFQAMKVNVIMPNTDETTEESPGEFIADATIHANAPMTSLVIDDVMQYGIPGDLVLSWDTGKLDIYSSPSATSPLSVFRAPAAGFSAQTLYVKGKEPGTCDVVLRYTEAEDDVFDFVHITVVRIVTETVATSPANRSRKLLGIGEEVSLSILPDLESLKNVTWSLQGLGQLKMESGMTFIAASIPSSPRVIAHHGTLELSLDFEVIQPRGVHMRKINNIPYGVGNAGAGMETEITLLPLTVSFYRVVTREERVPSIVTGYFQNYPQEHVGNPEWIPYNQNNIAAGSDRCSSRTCPEPWSEGSFTWNIPWKCKLANESDLTAQHFATVTQTILIHSTGEVSVSKAGAFVSRQPSDP